MAGGHRQPEGEDSGKCRRVGTVLSQESDYGCTADGEVVRGYVDACANRTTARGV